MRRPGALFIAPLLLAALLLPATGCKDDSPAEPQAPEGPDQAPEFSLTDVNPNSATAQQQVSPRDYLGRISAWYFGHAT